MYGNTLPIHLEWNCSSKNVRAMLTNVVEPNPAGTLFHQGVEAQHTVRVCSERLLSKKSRDRRFCHARLNIKTITQPGFFLWGFVKDQVYRTSVRDLADLQKRIMLLLPMSHHRYFITHGSRSNTGLTFPVSLMETRK